MSLDGTSNTFIPYTINGINPVAGSINTANFVKYSGNTSNTDLGSFDLITSGTISAQNFAIPDNNSNDESWITYSISTFGNPSTIGGLITTDITNGRSMYFTGSVLGAPNFQFATLAGNAGKVICTNDYGVFSTTINAGQLDYITGLTSQAGGVGQQNTWTDIQFHSADVSTTGSARFIQPYNAGVLEVSTLVNRATLDSAISAIPNLLTLSNTWSGTYNQFNGIVSTMGSNRFIQPYNAVSADISTLVNRATLDSAIAGLGAGILTLNNTWSGTNTFNNTLTTGAEYTTNLNGSLQTIQTATQFNPTLDANSYFITGVSPTTYVFTTNWTVNPVSGTTANIALDPAVFYFSTTVKYVISFTGIYGTGASWVGTVFNNSTSLTVSDASIAITTSPQNLSMTFTAGSSNPTIYLRFVGASGTLRWTNFTIKEVDTQIMGNLTLSSQIDSNIIQSSGRTANVAGGLKVNQTSVATAPTLTTTSLPAGVSASSLSGSYTLTATAGGTTFGMWLGTGFTYTAGAKYTYTFTGFSTNATATQAMILYTNTYTGGSGTFIGDYIVNVPITSSTVSGFFTATSNNNVVWNFVSSAAGRSISFTGFTLTRADTEIGGVITATGISSGTPATTIGLNSSNQLIKFTGPVDILPLNNIFTGTNQFNNGVQVAGGNLTCSLGTIAKQTATAGSLVQITGGGATFSPYLEFLFGGNSRGFIGQADSTSLDIASQNGASLRLFTEGTRRILIETNGNITATNNLIMNIQRAIYLYYNSGTNNAGLTTNASGDVSIFTGTSAPSNRLTIKASGDSSYIRFGPNATWNSYLTVGATPDRSGASNAQVISTNGNLHLDGGNSNDIYYGYYPFSRSLNNTHRFYGNIFLGTAPPFVSGGGYALSYSNGSPGQITRSNVVQRLVWYSNSQAWAGGVNATYAFYKSVGSEPIKLTGRFSHFVGGGGMSYPYIRIYSQSSGVYSYYSLQCYFNITYNHTPQPIDLILTFSDIPYTGWFDVYFYNNGGCITDANDFLWINATNLISTAY